MGLITSSTVRRTCLLCSADKHVCGGPSDVTPVDDPIHLKRKESTMEDNEMGEYTYKVYGNEVTGQLTKKDAERLGATPVEDDGEAKAKPVTKARKATNKAATVDDDE